MYFPRAPASLLCILSRARRAIGDPTGFPQATDTPIAPSDGMNVRRPAWIDLPGKRSRLLSAHARANHRQGESFVLVAPLPYLMDTRSEEGRD